MTKYRFKTEQEFISEFGEDWRNGNCCGLNFSITMDYLLGTEIDDSIIEEKINDIGNIDLTDVSLYFRIKKSRFIGFGIRTWMIKKNNVINYNNKKVLVYD